MKTFAATNKERQTQSLENVECIKQVLLDKGYLVYDAIYALPQSQSCWDLTKGKWGNTRRAKDACRFVVVVNDKTESYKFLFRVIDADYRDCIVCVWTLFDSQTHDGTSRPLHEYGQSLGMHHVFPSMKVHGYHWEASFLRWFNNILGHIRAGHKKCELCGQWVLPTPGYIEGLHNFICESCVSKYKL